MGLRGGVEGGGRRSGPVVIASLLETQQIVLWRRSAHAASKKCRDMEENGRDMGRYGENWACHVWEGMGVSGGEENKKNTHNIKQWGNTQIIGKQIRSYM